MDVNEVSSNTPATLSNTGVETGFLAADAEELLRALRNVIIPLVVTIDVDKHTNQKALGSDGQEFVAALQKFMTSFLRSQRGSMGGVELELSEKGAEIHDAVPLANITLHDRLRSEDVANGPPVAEPPPDIPGSEELYRIQGLGSIYESPHGSANGGRYPTSVEAEDGDTFGRQKQQFLDKLMKALREHVFKTMPIRLLCFKPHASKLQITLVERGAIYTHVAEILKATIQDASFLPNLVFFRYAILSHTWLRGSSGEVTYSDWSGGKFDARHPGYQKLLNFCKVAWEDHGVTFGWMDTVCINKESSAELDESIRSMYKWYRDAHVCITYLAETSTLSGTHNDPWFTRGWTLQELIAPTHMKFYNMDWNKLVDSLEDDKHDRMIWVQIKKATTITATELLHPITSLSISRRMQMAANRQVTREEDIAYSLMGIFDVSIATAYGEGAERAYSRLLQEILHSSNNVIDMFNWAGSFGARISRLLPSSPQGYMHRSQHQRLTFSNTPIEPLMLTHLGLRITIVLMPAVPVQKPTSRYDSIGDYHAIANVSRLSSYPLVGGRYSLLDARISGDLRNKEQNRSQLAFGILNVAREETKIGVPKHCLAVGLRYYMDGAYKIPTEAPIIFTLDKRGIPDGGEPIDHSGLNDCYYIERSELESHGMKLFTMYL